MLDPAKEAIKLLARFGVNTAPVPVDQIAAMLGAKVIPEFSPDPEVSGMVVLSPSGPVIGVNARQPSTRQRFTIAHEIGHLVMHSALLSGNVHIDKMFSVRLNRDKRSSLGNDLVEIQANRFAAELLMPTAMIREDLRNKYIDMENANLVAELARKYQVSEQAMSIRIFEHSDIS